MVYIPSAPMPYPLITPNYAPSTVLDRFSNSETFANSAYATTVAALNSLKDIAMALELINKVIPLDTTSIPTPEISVTPPTIDEEEYRMELYDLPSDPQLIDAQIGTLPEFPDLVIGDLQPPNETYISSLLTAIKAKLLNDVNTGSTGLTPAVEDAIFKREYERSILEQKDLEDSIAAEWSSRGFPLPNGALIAGIDQAKINFTNKRLDMSRDVSIKSFDLALQNYHFIIQQGIGLESQLMDYAHSIAVLAFQVADATIKNTLSAFSERRQGIRDKIAAILDKAKTKIQYNLGLIETFTAKINAYSAKIKGEADRVNAVARKDEAKTTVFRGVADFDIAKAGLDLKVIQARIDQFIGNSSLLIKDKEVEMKNYELLNSIKEKAMEAIAQVASQITASALTMVHASASIGSDIHYGLQTSASVSAQASESASFDYNYDITE